MCEGEQLERRRKSKSLILCMKDKACMVMSQLLSEDKNSFERMVKALREKIGMRQVPEAAKATLKARRRKVRMDFLSIFLEDFRGPRKTDFCLKITGSKSASNHGTLQPKSTNFQSLVFIPKTDKLLLWHLKWKGKT